MQLIRPQVYLILLGVIAFNIVLAPFTFAEIAFDKLWVTALIAVGFGGLVWFRRDVVAGCGRLTRLTAGFFEMIALIALMKLAFRILDHVTKANSIPLADDLLSMIDQMMGLNWEAYFLWVHHHAWLHPLLINTYNGLEPAMVAGLIALFLTGHSSRAKALIESIVICSLISVAIGAFFPAVAAIVHYLGTTDPALYPNFAFMPGVYHMESLTALRDPATTYRIGEGYMLGLNTFPSMHTATAILLLVAARGTWLALPAWAFAIPMLMATPVWGGHYFIDIVAGTAMALAVAAAVWRSHGMAGHRRPAALRPSAPA